MTQEQITKYENELRARILNKLNDLHDKIEHSEPCPEIPQDIHLLIGIDDYLDKCLNNWYY